MNCNIWASPLHLSAQKGDERLCSMILKHYVQRRASTPGMRDPRIAPDQGGRLPYQVRARTGDLDDLTTGCGLGRLQC